MAAKRGPRLQVGSAAWVAEERLCALQIAQSEVEEFSYSARNDLEWLNEHMAGIFDENERNIAETFKTPGKLRGKTPRTLRKGNLTETRVPLSDVFSATPNGSTTRVANQHNFMKSPLLHSRAAKASPIPSKAPSPRRNIFSPKPGPATQDSGYFGSQDMAPLNIHADIDMEDTQHYGVDQVVLRTTATVPLMTSPSRPAKDSPEKTFQTAKEEQTTRFLPEPTAKPVSPSHIGVFSDDHGTEPLTSPSPQKTSPVVAQLDSDLNDTEHQTQHDGSPANDLRSPSDGSSPIRPMVRKSSLNFATLPAREPLGAAKSIGARMSQTNHLDHNRMSYYNRQTGGKSLGNLPWSDVAENEDNEDMDMDEVDEIPPLQPSVEADNLALNHNKTYTQRLQDQITRLGNSQANSRQSRSIPDNPVQQRIEPIAQTAPAPPPKSPSPTRKHTTQTTPGAFPEDDDEDDWIDPPATAPQVNDARPVMPKSHSADVMEGIYHKDTIGQAEFTQPGHQQDGQSSSTERAPVAHGQSRPVLGHGKSASVSAVPFNGSIEALGPPLTKAATLANPAIGMLGMDRPETPKSPARSFRDSPLKQVKNKLSSILKSSRGLLASSAAISAEGKSSLLSPSTTRLGLHQTHSTDSIIPKPSFETQKSQAGERQGSPTRPLGRRTRASVEREKEEKRREKESKRLADQMDKLDKAREKEREKARVFSKEQDRIVSMERQLASKKDVEQLAPKETPKPTRTSPRKARVPDQEETEASDQDVEMVEAPSAMPPPSAARVAAPGQSCSTKEIKRPIKPVKEIQTKPKQAPTVIRVNTGSQHPQYHTAPGAIPTNSQETLASSSSQPQSQLASKASKATLHTKPSTQSLKSSTSSTGRPKALDLAAKKKEQDEREAHRRREAKAELERKRAVAQEEQRRQEQQRRQEADKQRQKERETAAAEAKKSVQRQAALEKAKQTRAPPPAVRSQPNGPPDFSLAGADGQPTRPQSRMASNIHRSQEDAGRTVNAMLPLGAKAGAKRTLPESNEENQAKRPPSRGGPTYQAKDTKRRRTSEDHKGEGESANPPNIKGPPVRPSNGFKKDMPTKSVFQNGYSNAPPSATRDLFKATVTAQHNGPAKTAHPLDMAQISKGTIPFAPNANAAGSSYKTPARPGAFNPTKSAAKSAPRSSPRFQNGDSIELPEIQTDDEDDDDDDAHGMSAAAWADSPEIRRALMRQEGMDPSQIFGPPAALNMEEVFSTSKDRWHKFRARTSSANWSGADRLTEDDIRKDMVARDKLRREGAWSYEMGKDLL